MNDNDLLDKFAGLAMQSIMAENSAQHKHQENDCVAGVAYDLAEAMVEERKRRLKRASK